MKFYKWLFVFLFSATLFGQTHYISGSGFGFGITSPHLFSDTYIDQIYVGAHAYYLRDFDEVNSARLRFDYNTMSTTPLLSNKSDITNVGLSLDYLFKFVPCSPLKMYFGTGFGVLGFKINNPTTEMGNAKKLGLNAAGNQQYGETDWIYSYGVNFIVGSQWELSREWELHGEFNHHTVGTDRFDGLIMAQGGLFGGTLDTWVGLDFGAIYYFDRGEESKYCEPPSGVSQNYYSTGGNVDYDKITNIVNAAKQPAPAPVDYKRIEDIVGRIKMPEVTVAKAAAAAVKPVFVGINFAVDKAEIAPENFAILAQAVVALMQNPDIKLDVIGYTDADASDTYNQKLSLQRANNVRDWLIAKGIDGGRLTAVAMSESSPVASNETAMGKALNRRVEFKVK